MRMCTHSCKYANALFDHFKPHRSTSMRTTRDRVTRESCSRRAGACTRPCRSHRRVRSRQEEEPLRATSPWRPPDWRCCSAVVCDYKGLHPHFLRLGAHELLTRMRMRESLKTHENHPGGRKDPPALLRSRRLEIYRCLKRKLICRSP
jgi:hypothetical protein